MHRRSSLLRIAVTVVLALLAMPGGTLRAAPKPESPSALCLTAIQAAEHRYNTPPGLLAVIAKVESGRATSSGELQPWPWTVDADGQGVFFATKMQAVAWSRQALDSGSVTYLDVGCMQVDLRMHPNAFRSLEEAFEPASNAAYGARFLRELHDGIAGGNWYIAIGLYHSQTPGLAALYRQTVAAVGAGLPRPAMPGGHLGTMRLDLVGGGVLRMNVHRQPARVHRRLSACQIAAILGSYLPRRVAGCAAGR